MEKKIGTQGMEKQTPLLHHQERRKKTRIKRKWLKPYAPISPNWYLMISISSFLILLVVWSLITYTGFVDPLFLPTPTDILVSGYRLFTEFEYAFDIIATVYRVLAGFALAVVIALPMGVLIGTFKAAEAFFEPMISFVRYMPASAFIPLFILWIGVGDAEKVAIIFFGSFFSIVLMIAVEVASVRRELLEAAYTLGCSDFGVLRSVVIPASMPGIMESVRLVLGWAWTYIIVAELVAASSGIGNVILESQRMLRTGNIIFGIVSIGVLGLLSDLILKALIRRMFPWNYGR